MLTDAGPLVAMLNAKDSQYAPCRQVAAAETEPLVTSWPVIAEAMHMLGKYEGWRGQRQLLDMMTAGDLLLVNLERNHVDRIRALMDKYSDVPMDFADASLVVLAESLHESRIFTLDSDFHIYRLNDKNPFDVVP
jgi:predicted nucleic acid-binding protein